MVGVMLNEQAPMLGPNQKKLGDLTEWGRLSTDDLLVKIDCFVQKKKIFSRIKAASVN
jgi:hypothetical protein